MSAKTSIIPNEEILSALESRFPAIFGEGPSQAFFAPGRVNLIGEHTDYNGGHVFPCALSFGTFARARKRGDNRIRLASLNIADGAVREFSVNALKKGNTGDWTNYPKGVIWAFREAGHPLSSGLDILFYGNIPAGSGLSSSASLEVLTGLILRELFGFSGVTQTDLALLGQRAENDFVGMNCGIMDQFASAMGKEANAIYLDTNTLTYEYAPLNLPDQKIVITNSAVKHQLASSAYNTRRSECEQAVQELNTVRPLKALGELTPEEFDSIKDAIKSENVLRRARHAVTENARTLAAYEALKNNDLVRFGELMNGSHDSLQYDFEVSCPEVDFLVSEARKLPGVLGSRITGGGFGGCTVSIVNNENVDEFRTTLAALYKEKYGLNAVFYIASPADGAHTLKL